MPKDKIRKIIRYAICGLPLGGILVSSALLNSARLHQFLILIALIWFQAFILFEVFSTGK
jgi:hypothetical protein